VWIAGVVLREPDVAVGAGGDAGGLDVRREGVGGRDAEGRGGAGASHPDDRVVALVDEPQVAVRAGGDGARVGIRSRRVERWKLGSGRRVDPTYVAAGTVLLSEPDVPVGPHRDAG